MNRSTVSRTLGLSLLALGLGSPALGAPHLGIALRTYPVGTAPAGTVRAGLDPTDSLAANGNAQGLLAGPPVSAKQSCNACHDYQAITSAYHFQLGLDERVDADGDGMANDLGQVLAGPAGPLATLPTLYNVSSPGQFGGW